MTSIYLRPDDDVEDTRLERGDPRVVRNVTRPTLTPYLPEGYVEGGPAVIVAPGGAFHMLSVDSEGAEVAEVLRARGIAAYLLEYRLIPTPPDDLEFFLALQPYVADLANPVELVALIEAHQPTFREDGTAALAWVRERHSKVGLVGFSAGGILAADLIALEDAALRPDAAALVYVPLRTPPTAPDGAPPLFVLAATDDPFGVQGSFDLQRVWAAGGHRVELHLYPQGGHGFGTAKTGFPVDAWPELLVTWLRAEGF